MQIDERYIRNSTDEMLQLLEKLCRIPSPSNHEEKKAAFCRDWLEAQGAKGVFIDSALNVVYPMNCEGRDDLVVFMAHTDTVFPDLEPMPYREDRKNVYSPGAGDDTACLAVMLMVIKYLLKKQMTPKRGVLFVANSGEEGLGNLKGVRQIMADYAGRITEVYTFDGQYDSIVNCPVGSHRYLVEAETEGGHSYSQFGNKNAIAELAVLITRLYQAETPKIGDSHTTYNVGTIKGGTSVNTIAQYAQMLYEYRSDNAVCLQKMKEAFYREIEAISSPDVRVRVTVVGERPCMGDVDAAHLDRVVRRCMEICERHSKVPCSLSTGSTDSNIPMSMGIPSICVGTYRGGGPHTREEWVEKASLKIGLRIAGELILDCF